MTEKEEELRVQVVNLNQKVDQLEAMLVRTVKRLSDGHDQVVKLSGQVREEQEKLKVSLRKLQDGGVKTYDTSVQRY